MAMNDLLFQTFSLSRSYLSQFLSSKEVFKHIIFVETSSFTGNGHFLLLILLISMEPPRVFPKKSPKPYLLKHHLIFSGRIVPASTD